jgi:hypothetical protein
MSVDASEVFRGHISNQHVRHGANDINRYHGQQGVLAALAIAPRTPLICCGITGPSALGCLTVSDARTTTVEDVPFVVEVSGGPGVTFRRS